MNTVVNPTRHLQRNRISGSLELRGQSFDFYLARRDVELGSAGKVPFYYMPPAELRGDDPVKDISNFRSCIGHWFAAMHEIGEGDDPHQQRHFVMATCFALVNRDKGPQSIYRDSFLRSDRFETENSSLPDDIRLRIQRTIRSRNRDAIKRELDDALDAIDLSRGDQLGYQEAFAVWADKGVNALRLQGEDGLYMWLQEVDYWLHKYRKRCPPRVRGFIDFFSYQAKVSFYLCFANFWRSLIPWIEENHGLDELSKRFLHLWHNQNQPIEIPHGRTLGGIWYPTTRGAQFFLPAGERGGFAPRQITWPTEHIGPTHVPDVFSGQVLSLHPLGWCLLSDPALREVVGRCVSSPKFDTAVQTGADEFPEYWQFVDAVLTAAHQYKRARENYENERGVHHVGGDSTSHVSRDDAPPPSPGVFLRGYVSSLVIRCACGDVFSFDESARRSSDEDVTSADDGSGTATEDAVHSIPLCCSACGTENVLSVTEQEIEDYLLGGGE